MPLITRPVLRRTTFAAAPLVALAGCRWGPADDAAPAPSPTGSTAPADDDAAIAADALQATNTVAALVAEVASRHRGLAGPLADVTLMHQAHADLLAEAGEPADGPTPPPSPATSKRALALVLSEERDLQRTLADGAGRAASGTFARALASMSAAVAQQRTVLAALPVRQAP